MELLLNLFWLLLAVNALAAGWMVCTARGVSRLRRSLLVGCIALLVFPIVSASDDVRALAMESEDSAASKPGSQKHAKSHGSNCQSDAMASSGAHVNDLVPPSQESRNPVKQYSSRFPMPGSAMPMACRPPPVPSPFVLVAAATAATQHRLGATSPSSGGGAAYATAQKHGCLDRGERHGKHDTANRADDIGNPLAARQQSSRT
jgi:hypothetical protein